MKTWYINVEIQAIFTRIIYNSICWGILHACFTEIMCFQWFFPKYFKRFGCLKNLFIEHYSTETNTQKRQQHHHQNYNTLNRRSTNLPVYGSMPVIGGAANGTPLNE